MIQSGMDSGDSGTARRFAAEERLLLFEIGSENYALPVDGLLEVIDMGEIGCIPTIPPFIAGVVNYHGDALAVVHRSKLLGIGIVPETGTEQILVVTDCVTATARFALPVDRVLGLVPGRAEEVACGNDPVTERITINGRVTSVLDPRRLVERAKELIERSVGGID